MESIDNIIQSIQHMVNIVDACKHRSHIMGWNGDYLLRVTEKKINDIIHMIEKCIREIEPNIVYETHPSDNKRAFEENNENIDYDVVKKARI